MVRKGVCVVTEEMLVKRFAELEEEMRNHYFWCKVKMNAYAIVLILLLYFK
jgi:hypothetical protein